MIPAEEELIRLLNFGTTRKIRDFLNNNPSMNPHYPNQKLTSPLRAAIHRSDPAILSTLIDKLPCNLDATLTYPCGRSILMYAAYSSNDPEMLQVLIRKGADPMKIDINGWNSLFHAVIGRRLQNVAALIDCQVPIDSLDREGRTPLMISVYLSNTEIFNYLISRGANVKIIDNNGLNALHLAILRRRRDCVIALSKIYGEIDVPAPFSKVPTYKIIQELMSDILPVRKRSSDDEDDND